MSELRESTGLEILEAWKNGFDRYGSRKGGIDKLPDGRTVVIEQEMDGGGVTVYLLPSEDALRDEFYKVWDEYLKEYPDVSRWDLGMERELMGSALYAFRLARVSLWG